MGRGAVTIMDSASAHLAITQLDGWGQGCGGGCRWGGGGGGGGGGGERRDGRWREERGDRDRKQTQNNSTYDACDRQRV